MAAADDPVADFDPIAGASHGRSLPQRAEPPPLVQEMLRVVESRAGAPIADAIRQCLHDNPAARPTARELLQRHPAFSSRATRDSDVDVVCEFLLESGLGLRLNT
uniref:Protein kinase domain-containing protein n=1 Tax=Neobodo designis TaxID=312471 RepID=A0A7S1Q0K3_NEODS